MSGDVEQERKKSESKGKQRRDVWFEREGVEDK